MVFGMDTQEISLKLIKIEPLKKVHHSQNETETDQNIMKIFLKLKYSFDHSNINTGIQ